MMILNEVFTILLAPLFSFRWYLEFSLVLTQVEYNLLSGAWSTEMKFTVAGWLDVDFKSTWRRRRTQPLKISLTSSWPPNPTVVLGPAPCS